ncbi:hypothetical protein MNBD_GAMMA10-1221 [hydrothermal vent metagenome]|uniref:DUF4124 domain-containing protein n=1 Tax=hydrothermal vent metagenome TaxID=652676 RepID=A0A3B0XS93_9ZZZZ
MNKIALITALLVSQIHLSPAFAEMYKWVDADGNISYSDQPPYKGAEQLEAPLISTTPAIKVPPKTAKPKEEDEDKNATKYSYFKITSPENDATIRDNNGNFSIAMNSRPSLDVAAGHYISILIDGKAVKKQSSTTASFSNIDRGTHKISAQIKNRANKVLRSASAVTLHLHRQIAPKKQAR